MQIQCTNGTPIVNTLDHLPPLPLRVDYSYSNRIILTKQDELGIYHALQLHDRVRHIDLYLPPSILHKCLVLMDARFPILAHLSLSFKADKITTLTLPKAFLAPNLCRLDIPGIVLPKRLRALTYTISLVKLVLSNIPASSYLRPRLLVARLLSLPQLEELSIGFSIPIPRPSAETELLGEQGAPITLPNLKILKFKGVCAYLECLLAQIRVPLLMWLDITLFNQITFALLHLSHLINITEGLKFPIAEVSFEPKWVTIFTSRHDWRQLDGPFCLRVKCQQLDWQIDCAAQIFGALIPALSGVTRFRLNFYHKALPTEWENGEIDGTTWHELLRPFIGVKELHICEALLEEVARALQADEGGLEPGFLPNLQYIIARENRFASFIYNRQVVSRPVRFLLAA